MSSLTGGNLFRECCEEVLACVFDLIEWIPTIVARLILIAAGRLRFGRIVVYVNEHQVDELLFLCNVDAIETTIKGLYSISQRSRSLFNTRVNALYSLTNGRLTYASRR